MMVMVSGFPAVLRQSCRLIRLFRAPAQTVRANLSQVEKVAFSTAVEERTEHWEGRSHFLRVAP
jgi:hypothetical protein